jgi:hypothetical protein
MNRTCSPLPPAVREYATALPAGAMAQLFDLFARIKPALERVADRVYLMAQTIYHQTKSRIYDHTLFYS